MPFELRPFRVPPETEVYVALAVAREAASVMGHAEVRPEHLALALCSDPEIARHLDDLGARREAIETALEDVLELLPCRPPESEHDAERDREPSFDAVVRHALRRADACPSGVDRLGLLAVLFEESSAAEAILRAGGSPSALRGEACPTPTAESPEVAAYRSPDRRRTWTVRLLDGGRTPREFLVSATCAMGLSRVATTRAAALAQAEQAPQVGLMTEADARHHANVAEASARAEGHGLRAVPEPLPEPARCITSSEAVVAWWRGVMALRLSFAALLFIAAALSVRALRQERSIVSASAAGRGDAERAVTLSGRVIPSGRRYLLPEGLPFAADPRRPDTIATLASVSAREKLDTRVAVERVGAYWSTACSFEAEREIPGPISSRPISSRWSLVRSKNGLYNILLVGGRDHSGPLVGTVRAVRDAGRPVAELLSARCRLEIAPTFVFDVDPLPEGEVQTWVPICADRAVLNRSCVPALWGVVTDGHLADWPRDESWRSLDGWLGTVHDRRLRIESSEHADSPRTLRLGPVPRRPLGRAVLPALLCLLFGVAAGVAARRRRQRGRPRHEQSAK